MEMYSQAIEWDLLYVLQISKPQTFQKLATKVHNMEVTIANRRSNSFGFGKLKKDKLEFKRISSLRTQLKGRCPSPRMN